ALPDGDARVKVSAAAAIRLVVTNLVLGREPLYGLGEWANRYDPALLGLTSQDISVLNDDRVGRALEALFDADRASLLTAVVLRAISEFSIDTSQLHNDSTSISVHGVYSEAIGTARGGKPTPVITWGHSKDHRPDLKQLVWILTVSADGAVPIAYRLADGNTSDDPTHVPTWDGLVGLLGRTDFLYVADSKLCSRKAMGHIDSNHGRFVTVLPRSAPRTARSVSTCRPTPRSGPKRPADPVSVSAMRTRSTPRPPRHYPRRRGIGSCGSTRAPRPAATPTPGQAGSTRAPPRSRPWTPSSPDPGAGSRPVSRSRRPRQQLLLRPARTGGST
ncbi:MAG: IS1634 family transposase, partial [Mycobacteriaceae bacterium]